MKKVLLAAAAALLAGNPAQAQWLITGVCDGPVSPGGPKFAEIKNVSGGPIDLSVTNYYLNYYASPNASTLNTNDLNALTGGATIADGEFLVLYDTSVQHFDTVYPSPPSNVTVVEGVMGINGDDAVIVSTTADNTGIIDTYGDVGVEGTGTGWEHLDSYAIRISGPATTTWSAPQWNVGAVNYFDTNNTAGDVAAVFPLGVNSSLPVELDSFSVE